MNINTGLKCLLMILLLLNPLAGQTQPAVENANTASASGSQLSPKQNGDATLPEKSKASTYSGYSVDGRTSASVLAAQRSHTVAGEEETKFAVFSGLVIIGLIIFFTQILSNKK